MNGLIRGHWYWLKQYGDMADNEWTKISSTWVNWSKIMVMAESEILKVNGTWYRFEASGKMSEKTNLSVGQIKNCDYLNLEISASTSGSIVGTMYNNEYIEILERIIMDGIKYKQEKILLDGLVVNI